jgi:hypothetical protein
MARERRSPEEIVAKLRQVEAQRLRGKTCAEAVRSIGVSAAVSSAVTQRAARTHGHDPLRKSQLSPFGQNRSRLCCDKTKFQRGPQLTEVPSPIWPRAMADS